MAPLGAGAPPMTAPSLTPARPPPVPSRVIRACLESINYADAEIFEVSFFCSTAEYVTADAKLD